MVAKAFGSQAEAQCRRALRDSVSWRGGSDRDVVGIGMPYSSLVWGIGAGRDVCTCGVGAGGSCTLAVVVKVEWCCGPVSSLSRTSREVLNGNYPLDQTLASMTFGGVSSGSFGLVELGKHGKLDSLVGELGGPLGVQGSRFRRVCASFVCLDQRKSTRTRGLSGIAEKQCSSTQNSPAQDICEPPALRASSEPKVSKNNSIIIKGHQ
jgi:hypothetical protein